MVKRHSTPASSHRCLSAAASPYRLPRRSRHPTDRPNYLPAGQATPARGAHCPGSVARGGWPARGQLRNIGDCPRPAASRLGCRAGSAQRKLRGRRAASRPPHRRTQPPPTGAFGAGQSRLDGGSTLSIELGLAALHASHFGATRAHAQHALDVASALAARPLLASAAPLLASAESQQPAADAAVPSISRAAPRRRVYRSRACHPDRCRPPPWLGGSLDRASE